jgi:hypothetical protein
MAEAEGSPAIRNLSYSSVSSYLTCGRYWKYRYLDRIPAPSASVLVFGSAFHSTIESYLCSVAESGSSADLVDIWDREWPAMIAKEGQIAWGDESADTLRDQGARMLRTPEIVRIVQAVTPLVSADGRVHIEDFVNMMVPDVPVPVIGYVDIITGDGVPGDFKTASRAWAEGAAQNELQPLFYLAALEQGGYRGNPDLRFRHYVFTKTDPASAQVIESRRAPGEIAFALDVVREVWKGIAGGVFAPNPTTWKCSSKYCEYWGMCRGAALEQ